MRVPILKTLLSLFSGILIFLSCGTTSSHKTLTFFFDGVPQQEKSRPLVLTQGPKLELLQRSVDSNITTMKEVKAAVVHKVYQDKACDKCHAIEHSYRLIQRQPDLCYQCHAPFEQKYQRLHGPVAAGFCNACHEAHKSDYKALLKMPIRQVCQHCHEPGDVEKNVAHQKINTTGCLTCHDAHGGNSAHLLRKDFNSK